MLVTGTGAGTSSGVSKGGSFFLFIISGGELPCVVDSSSSLGPPFMGLE
jgi:hypothetical protein